MLSILPPIQKLFQTPPLTLVNSTDDKLCFEHGIMELKKVVFKFRLITLICMIETLASSLKYFSELSTMRAQLFILDIYYFIKYLLIIINTIYVNNFKIFMS